MRRAMIRLLLCLVSACLTVPAFAADSPFQLTREFPGVKMQRPVSLLVAPDGTQRLFLVQQTGKVLILPKDRTGA